MIVGIGTDLLAVARMRSACLRRGEALAARLLHPDELQILAGKEDPARWLAKRFAAKEALLKALGTGLRQGLSWQDMAVLPDELGRPEVNWHGAALARLEYLGGCRTHLSISDEQDYVLAFAIIESGA